MVENILLADYKEKRLAFQKVQLGKKFGIEPMTSLLFTIRKYIHFSAIDNLIEYLSILCEQLYLCNLQDSLPCYIAENRFDKDLDS